MDIPSGNDSYIAKVLKLAIEIVDDLSVNMVIFHSCVSLPEGTRWGKKSRAVQLPTNLVTEFQR